MSRRPPARIIKSNTLNTRDRRVQAGLSELEPRQPRRANGLLIKLFVAIVVLAAIALWGSAFAAVAVALSGEMGLVAIRQSFASLQ